MPEKEKKSYIDSSQKVAKNLRKRNGWFNVRTSAASVVVLGIIVAGRLIWDG